MPILTGLMEQLNSAWSFLGHVTSRATGIVSTLGGASARKYQRSGGFPPPFHSLVRSILERSSDHTSPTLSSRENHSKLTNWEVGITSATCSHEFLQTVPEL